MDRIFSATCRNRARGDASAEASTSTGLGSTSDADASTGGSESSSSGDVDVEPEFTCDDDGCSASCRGTVEEVDSSGEACTCGATRVPDNVVPCSIQVDGSPCYRYGRECSIQALRYGIPGTYRFDWHEDESGGGSVEYTVFGPGRASATLNSWRYCCGYSNSGSGSRYFHVQDLRPPDDERWDDCAYLGSNSLSELPSCLNPDRVLSGSSCEAPDACPEPSSWPGPEAGCERACPMANDGVCDESTGTGLCADGCDPVDCGAERPPKG
ncbi:MAG: hypothetical protein AAGA54_15780 [Myxococcota bacterium]